MAVHQKHPGQPKRWQAVGPDSEMMNCGCAEQRIIDHQANKNWYSLLSLPPHALNRMLKDAQ
jgi:hypothetical protein